MKMKNNYYLGLDIGTDSVGYAVTDTDYSLLKFKGEPMWGATLFDAAVGAEERRAFRVNRRRLDRKQQRVALLSELFAEEICKIDPKFFIRRKESALFEEDSQCGVQLFDGGNLTDKEYHKRYPTIHHLIYELMTSAEPHDIRLVYIACAWLVANRGHFLLDIPADNIEDILSFSSVYNEFLNYLYDEEYTLPWGQDITAETVQNVLQLELGVTKKEAKFKEILFGGRKLSKEKNENFPITEEGCIKLLAGGKVKPADIYGNSEYAEIDSVSLVMNDEDFMRIVSELGDDGEILIKLRSLKNCAQLITAMKGAACISEGKIHVYEQHRKDLEYLKQFVKRYCPNKYNEVFRKAKKGLNNYAAYSKNLTSVSDNSASEAKFCNKEDFCAFVKGIVKSIKVNEEDKAAYEDMMLRLELCTFMPKQTDGDNRVIPQQLYRYELNKILDCAKEYTPLLNEVDDDGITVLQKVLSIFDFRVPYYVGPLKDNGGKNFWMVRKAQGKIYPWNFESMVDLDRSEQGFIKRMTNSCTYLPGENVLPVASLLYNKFMVLNELNNIKVNGVKLPVSVKQELYHELFEKYNRVSVKKIKDYLIKNGCMDKQDEFSGLDDSVKSSLKSYHIFKRMLEDGVLSETDAEKIIEYAAYSEDKNRMRKWLKTEYPNLSEENIDHIARQNLKEFGRLSRKFLTGVYGTEKGSDGLAYTIIDMLWNTNENLMQLLSEKYTFADAIQDLNAEYYSDHPQTLEDRLSDLYVPNAVKRPIYRTLDIVHDMVKAAGGAPAKIFVEMARGAAPEQKGKRTQSRKDQLLALYKNIKTDDARRLAEELESMPDSDNSLQSKRLFLYYLQLGRSAYTGKPIELSNLSSKAYDIDHIYPQCHVKDDSILNNLVLVESEKNGRKSDIYPISSEIRESQKAFWQHLKNVGLMTDEKFRRLTRATPFTDDERQGFINRQLVETRQSTKVIASLLQERFPDAEIVYVKAGMVSEFRQEFDLLKSRTANDLHHAKDAYLNIVVGNVYHERFTKKWFNLNSKYNVQVKKIFELEQRHGDECYWRGENGLALVRKTMGKNAVHLTKYAFRRGGGLFDQQPMKKGSTSLIPLKKGLDPVKYGGYNKPSASFFVLARYRIKKATDIMIVPINLLDADRFMADPEFARQRTAEMVESIKGKHLDSFELLLNGRILKINTVFSVDGTLLTLSGKSGGGAQVIFPPMMPLALGKDAETYIKAMESFKNKLNVTPQLVPDERYDGISKEKNVWLYDMLVNKLNNRPFSKMPGNKGEDLVKPEAYEKFSKATAKDQINCLLGLISLMNGKLNFCDLTAAGQAVKAGGVLLSSTLSNWAKKYKDVRIVDMSASGLFAKSSENLLDLL